jgi:hypothetical protein
MFVNLGLSQAGALCPVDKNQGTRLTYIGVTWSGLPARQFVTALPVAVCSLQKEPRRLIRATYTGVRRPFCLGAAGEKPVTNIGTETLPRRTPASSHNDPLVPTALLSQGTAQAQSRDSAVKSIQVQPVPFTIAKSLLLHHHYLHSMPGGTWFTFGVFLNTRLLGVMTLGSGPFLAYQLVDGAKPDDCIVLSRLWLSDELPRNSESRALGIVLRALRRETQLKFVVAYSDPAAGHLGTIYQASNWLYCGLSTAMPSLDLGDGVPRHSRTIGQVFGSHSMKHLEANGVKAKLVPQEAKHRYVYLLDPAWRGRLMVSVLPYPKREAQRGSC